MVISKNDIPDKTYAVGTSDQFTFPAWTTDVDLCSTFTYTAALSGGQALPAWIQFAPATRTFNMNPTAFVASPF